MVGRCPTATPGAACMSETPCRAARSWCSRWRLLQSSVEFGGLAWSSTWALRVKPYDVVPMDLKIIGAYDIIAMML